MVIFKKQMNNYRFFNSIILGSLHFVKTLSFGIFSMQIHVTGLVFRINSKIAYIFLMYFSTMQFLSGNISVIQPSFPDKLKSVF